VEDLARFAAVGLIRDGGDDVQSFLTGIPGSALDVRIVREVFTLATFGAGVR
jgi:hypothetical protein